MLRAHCSTVMENITHFSNDPAKLDRIDKAKDRGNGEEDADPIHKDMVSSKNPSSISISSILELPAPVLSEILFKLPIKSVTVCKSVCKDFYSIISETGFSDCYVENSTFRPLFYRVPCFSELILLQISDTFSECLLTKMDPNIPDRSEKPHMFTFIDSCHGFVCLYFLMYDNEPDHTHRVFVSNPVTGNCIALPARVLTRGLKDYPKVRYYFGFDTSGNHFKVLGVPYNRKDEFKPVIITVGVDENWRTFPDEILWCVRSEGNSSSDAIVFNNGAFNWISKRGGSVSALELGEERYIQFDLPPGVGDSNYRMLRNFDDQLAVVSFASDSVITVFVMKEYAVPESWTAIVISTSWIIPDWLITSDRRSFIPIGQLADGRILFEPSEMNYLIAYSIKENRYSKIKMHGDSSTIRRKDRQNIAPNFFSPLRD